MIYNFAILKACFVEKIINDIISTCFKFATLEYSQNSANYHCKNIKYTVFVAHVLNVKILDALQHTQFKNEILHN